MNREPQRDGRRELGLGQGRGHQTSQHQGLGLLHQIRPRETLQQGTSQRLLASSKWIFGDNRATRNYARGHISCVCGGGAWGEDGPGRTLRGRMSQRLSECHKLNDIFSRLRHKLTLATLSPPQFFKDDVMYLLTMDKLWKKRKAPIPLDWHHLEKSCEFGLF